MTNDGRTVRPKWGLLAIALIVGALLLALGHGSALGQEIGPEFNFSGQFNVNPFVEPCDMTGQADVIFGVVQLRTLS